MVGGTYEQGVTLNAMEAELCRVRAMIAQQGAKDGVSHEGWLGVEGPPGADWERRFGRICMRETGAVLQLGLDEQRRVRPSPPPAASACVALDLDLVYVEG